jgi:peptidoglycan/xylan/chitin deacetylase (PgdA/CDA1 family)
LGFSAKGVVERFDANKKQIALTLDACGGSAKSSGYDTKLIEFLKANQIPAVLFINARWIDANPEIFAKLSREPLFDIENHGTHHKPLSLTGLSAYAIAGTKNAKEVEDEVMINHQKIKDLTGKQMHFFRSGTAHYDDESVKIVESLGYKVIGFSINADAGATNSVKQIEIEMSKAKPGDIIIAHMNHPESQNYEGLSKAILKLKKDGWEFVRLSDKIH